MPTDSTDAATGVSPVSYADLGPGVTSPVAAEIDLLSDVEMTVTVELGRTKMKVRDLLRMTEGSLIELGRSVGEAVDVLVNGSVIARGDVVVVDDELGIRITEFVSRS
jgi:flagellar motor switch protein FliN